METNSHTLHRRLRRRTPSLKSPATADEEAATNPSSSSSYDSTSSSSLPSLTNISSIEGSASGSSSSTWQVAPHSLLHDVEHASISEAPLADHHRRQHLERPDKTVSLSQMEAEITSDQAGPSSIPMYRPSCVSEPGSVHHSPQMVDVELNNESQVIALASSIAFAPCPSASSLPSPVAGSISASAGWSTFRREAKSQSPRLTRRQSLPNLRARRTYDLDLPAVHKSLLPVHFASHLKAIGCLCPTARTTSMTASTSNSPGPSTFMAQQMPSSAPSTSSSSSSTKKFTLVPILVPPIRVELLQELELSNLLSIPQLRHDAFFDPCMQIQAKFKGYTHPWRKEAIELYWTAVAREIELDCICTEYAITSSPAFTAKRFPCICAYEEPRSQFNFSRVDLLIVELRKILLRTLSGQTVTPTTHQPTATPMQLTMFDSCKKGYNGNLFKLASVQANAPMTTTKVEPHAFARLEDILDPKVMDQQLYHGCLDVVGLLTHICTLLQQSCAPSRLATVRKMIDDLETLDLSHVAPDDDEGDQYHQPNTNRAKYGLTPILRSLFELLEGMQLDLANDHLCRLRPWLCATASSFEANRFEAQLQADEEAGRTRQAGLQRTRDWWQASIEAETAAKDGPQIDPKYLKGHEQATFYRQVFSRGFIRLVFDSRMSNFSLAETSAFAFPETLQLDVLRMTAFHQQSIDLSLLCLFTLLFKQLASSGIEQQSSGSQEHHHDPARRLRISALTSELLKRVKAETRYFFEGKGGTSTTRTAPASGRPSGRSDLSLDARLNDPLWKEQASRAVHRIAVLASWVWETSSDPNSVSSSPPPLKQGTNTVPGGVARLVKSWSETHLRSEAPLLQMCLARVQKASLFWVDKHLKTMYTSSKSRSPKATKATTRKRKATVEEGQEEERQAATDSPRGSKRQRMNDGSISPTHSSSEESEGEEAWVELLARCSLTPLRKELESLGDRMGPVAGLNLATFGGLYIHHLL